MKELKELEELLIIVDMINGFVKEGVMHDDYIMHIVPRIKKEIERIKSKREGLAFIRDSHNENAVEFKYFPKHSVSGTSESEVIDELAKFKVGALDYEKNTTSIVAVPDFLRDIEQMKNLKRVIIAGCCTDICVFDAALGLNNYFIQNNKEVQIIVPDNMTETYEGPNHNREEYNGYARKLMKPRGIKVGEI